MDEKRRTPSQRSSNRTSAPTRRSVSGARRASVHGSSGGTSTPHPTGAARAPRTSRTDGATARATSRAARASRTDGATARATSRASRASRATAPKSDPKRFLPLTALVVVVVLLVLGVSALVRSCSSDQPGVTAPASSPASSAAKPDATVSFVAVGDNLPENILGDYAWEMGSDHYDYKPIYEFIQPLVQAADLAYVKEEVHLDDSLGVHGYPSFNAPESLADDLLAVGFDMFGSASNHIYDWGYFGACARNRQVWNEKGVPFAGSNLSAEEAQTIATFEKNGITFAFLDYTYGVNGYSEDDLDWWEVNFINKDRITADVNRAHELAEVVIVAMHWGTENYTGIDDFQAEYAQLLADLNVDLVLGSHPHVIGPVEWLDGADGHRTLVAYSLGNFLSHHDYPGPYNELEGMISCNFVRKGGKVAIENATWTPLVNHTQDDEGYYRIIPLKDYTNELGWDASGLWNLDDPVAWLQDANREIVGDAIAINDGRQ